MESLLDNPMKAVLYLKELTTIVQNQQSLIQTQRQRIDELERRVEELIGENRQLKEQHQPHHYHHHHHHPAPRSASPQSAALPHQHPGNSKAGTHPGQQPQQPRQHPSQSQQHLQLVPASSPSPQPSPTSPDSAEDCCKSLVLQKPATICRSVVLGRKPENKTVLHQFCCPAADTDQKADSSSCSTSDSKPASCDLGETGETEGRGEEEEEEEEEAGTGQQTPDGGGPTLIGVESAGGRGAPITAGQKASLHHTASPMRVQRNKGASSCSHSSTSDYELSLDLKNKQIEMLEHKYGGHLISRRAACTIQTAFRQYQLSKNFEKIRNSLLESRLPRRISLRKIRLQNSEGFSTEKALVEGYNFVGIPLVRSPSLPATISGALTELEDSFTEQVQSLAKSIDDALSTWSLKTMCSLQEGGTYQITETFKTSAPNPGGKEMFTGETAGQDIREDINQPDALPCSASTLMMAFRDVTVQIDKQNFCMSSSVMESTSVSLSNCLPQDSETICLEEKEVKENTPEDRIPEGEPTEASEEMKEFPDPPPSEEEENNTKEEQLALQKVENAEPDGTQEVVEAKRTESEIADNSSEQMSSSSTSTSAKSASEVSSKEALQAMILSLPRYHCENPASCKSPTLSTDVMRKRLYRIGLNLFNINPDKGIQFLISRGFIPDTPIGVAHFLLQRKGLSRQMIGEFLGNSKKQFNRDVLDCVVDEMDFSGMELDEALRKFQAHIRVQGEAQKVERLIEAFSQRYCMCNPDVVQQFHNPDTIFILAFAIILLNTDMYSPNIKPDRKMMLEDFIRNLRGVDDGADIPREMVVGIYERIQQRELRSNEDHVTYVTKVEQSIVGMKSVLSVPHRRLVCCSRLFEVSDINKAQKQAAHQREVFLFNDLLVILKLCPKKKSSATYTFCKAVGLLGMQFHLFENEYYPHGITIIAPFSGSEKKQVLNFCGQSAEELLKLVEDLKESIAEVTEMEQIRIEWELEKQQGAKSHPTKNNGSQLGLRGKQGSPPDKRDLEDKTGNNTLEGSWGARAYPSSKRCKSGTSSGLWEETGAPGRNPCEHGENVQTPYRRHTKPGTRTGVQEL
ncbi:IQ motif and SEC7 domain-containing protein 3-like isoform X8 [Erpetoichthys calabaricus]|uniref:IQ motif and SEC7 domain-containing protein 3-like isoform X5 n=1 Tax=Erpetoichthys calabaricus TaxID=27687 RepID=UPI002234BD24|nr:IQ motif and SEC7 domain-containing protein 3-like isoform X5 [Erpetoichthys calabaricus]XP_051786673.1 IQ motif and SEC7 domain-containing protein 3-like isoform X6 [Erpetoichthys calabaricus]XP_051786674.1 IQ motif and SEC7 domain-containing protein 3-like isoform X7 [Erpetoichthys calabaricus]XP_051786680.1 IQ motif and SEC7 domain-containing protein 3-like isoform X8 [Erpetoichthys calabaricus]